MVVGKKKKEKDCRLYTESDKTTQNIIHQQQVT